MTPETGEVAQLLGKALVDILCLKAQRNVRRDNWVSDQSKVLQIRHIRGRCRYLKATGQVHEKSDGRMANFHGLHKLAENEATGKLSKQGTEQARVGGLVNPRMASGCLAG